MPDLGPFELDTIVVGDCLDVMRQMPDGCVDLVITDPPYPDQHTELYNYREGLLRGLSEMSYRQLIFWSAKVDFPLDFTAIHIWDKKIGVASMYERIFERNGGRAYRVFSFTSPNNVVRASIAQDVVTGHPSQKPVRLIMRLVEKYSQLGDTIFDPFIGSGTTAVAAKKLGRHYFGCDINPEYVEMARQRVAKVDGVQLELI